MVVPIFNKHRIMRIYTIYIHRDETYEQLLISLPFSVRTSILYAGIHV